MTRSVPPQHPNTPAPQHPGLPYLLLDALFVTRPVLWIPVWAFAVLGYFRALQVRDGAGLTVLWDVGWMPDAAWILVFSCAVGAVYVVNQFADLRVDRANDGFPLVAKGRVTAATATAAAVLCALAAVLVPLAGRPAMALFALGALATGIVYSLPPFSLSGRPVADFLTNATGYGIIAFGAGWALSPAELPLVSREFAGAALPYFLLMCAGSISSTIPDLPGDRACGKRTTAVVFGARRVHLLATGLLGFAALSAALEGDAIALTCALAVLPLYGAYAVWPRRWLMEATYKAGGTLLMVAVAVVAPVFGGAAAAVFAGTWMYFRWRHGVAYPALTPDGPAATGTGTRSDPQ